MSRWRRSTWVAGAALIVIGTWLILTYESLQPASDFHNPKGERLQPIVAGRKPAPRAVSARTVEGADQAPVVHDLGAPEKDRSEAGPPVKRPGRRPFVATVTRDPDDESDEEVCTDGVIVSLIPCMSKRQALDLDRARARVRRQRELRRLADR